MREMVDVIDEQDKVIDVKERSIVESESLLHRTGGVVVFNRKGEILVHQRAKKRKLYPGKFDVKFSGYVQSDESYYETALRELFEESGIKAKKVLPLIKYRFDGPHNNVLARVYMYVHDGAFRIDPYEVEWAGFMSIAKISEMKDKLSPTGKLVFEKILRQA